MTQPILVKDEGKNNSFEIEELHSTGELPKTILKGEEGSVKIKKFFQKQDRTKAESREIIRWLKAEYPLFALVMKFRWWGFALALLVSLVVFPVSGIIQNILQENYLKILGWEETISPPTLNSFSTTTPYFDIKIESEKNSILLFSNDENNFKIKKVSWQYYDDYWKLQPLNNDDDDTLLYRNLVWQLSGEIEARIPKETTTTDTILTAEKISCEGIRHIDMGRYGFREKGIPMVVRVTYDNKLDLKEYFTIMTLYIENWDGFNFNPRFIITQRGVTQEEAEIFGIKNQLEYVNFLAQDAMKKSSPHKYFSNVTYKCIQKNENANVP